MDRLGELAFGVVCALKRDDPMIITKECLEALVGVFGGAEGDGELHYNFCSTYQDKGGKVSAYVLQLEKMLEKVIVKEGLTREGVNLARLNQVLIGVVCNNKILDSLNLANQKANQTGLRQVIKDIQEVEGQQAVKESIWPYGKANPHPATIRTLVVDTQDLQGRDEALREQVAVLPSRANPTGPKLRKSVEPAGATRGLVTQQPRNHIGHPFFCYEFGEDGHHSRHCGNAENPTMAWQILRAGWEELGNREQVGLGAARTRKPQRLQRPRLTWTPACRMGGTPGTGCSEDQGEKMPYNTG